MIRQPWGVVACIDEPTPFISRRPTIRATMGPGAEAWAHAIIAQRAPSAILPGDWPACAGATKGAGWPGCGVYFHEDHECPGHSFDGRGFAPGLEVEAELQKLIRP